MTALNVVFMGNLLYPEGLAEAKRFQHFIDGVMAGEGNSSQVLLLRQSHPGRAGSALAGEHRGVAYRTIGSDIRADLSLPGAVFRYLFAGCRMLRQAKRPGCINVLFAYGDLNIENLPFVLWARLLGYRIVVDIVEDSYSIAADAPWPKRLKAWSVQWTTKHVHWFADGVVVISSYLKQKVELIVRGCRPVQLIPVSVELERIPKSRSPDGGFNRPVRILYAGSFGEKDGVENLIAAFDQVAARRADIEMLMTGRGLPNRMASILSRVAASPFSNRLRYLGFLPDEDYFRILGDCDIPCVVRIDSEFADRGFPFKLGEYLAAGRPVIASRISDVSIYLVDRVNALLVPPGSISAIVEALDYLLDDEARALALGRAGRLVAVEHFSARNTGRCFLEFITKLDGS